MPDPFGLRRVGNAQDEVVILAALEPLSHAPDLFDEGTAIDAEMVDHVLAEQQIQIPVILEIGRKTLFGSVHHILIGIDDVDIGMRVDFGHNFVERMRRQYIVMVDKSDEVAARKIES